jgi:hypothetical protein
VRNLSKEMDDLDLSDAVDMDLEAKDFETAPGDPNSRSFEEAQHNLGFVIAGSTASPAHPRWSSARCTTSWTSS